MSSVELMMRYLTERWRPRALVPLSLLLAGAGWFLVADAAVSPSRLIASAAQGFLLVLACRVWDDLEDRGRDAVEHPERVMVTSNRTMPFVVLASVVGVAGLVPLAMASDANVRIAALVIAVATLLIWYRLRRVEWASGLGSLVVLIKYPAIALAVAPTIPALGTAQGASRTGITLVTLYLLICVYERFDDPAMRASRVTLP